MTSRTKNAAINIIVIIIMQIMTFLYSLISKRLFLQQFSLSAFGVIDLFSSFFGSLMLLELGFGTILIYNLYKPVANNDIEGVKKQVSIFKTIYAIVSGIIIIISILVLPFIYDIFNIAYEDSFFVYLIYIIHILRVLVKYYFLNKTSIFSAGQFKYIENIIVLTIDFLSFLIRIISLLIFHNIYLFFLGQLLFPTISYFIEGVWISKKYNLKDVKFAKVKEIIQSGAITQCRKYIYATVYTLIFNSMDNIIISALLSTDAVAYTTNYNSLFNTAYQVIVVIMLSLRGIIADYDNNSNDDSKLYGLFNIVSSFNFMVSSLTIVGLYSLIDNFIALWLGSNYIIAHGIMVSLLGIKLLDALFEPVNSIFIIKGYIFKEKLPLIISALTNIILTIVFINYFGLIGAYIATIIAVIIKWLGKLYYVLSGAFKEYKREVIVKYISYLILIIIECLLIEYVSSSLIISVNSLLMFILKIVIVVISTCLINVAIIMTNKDTREYVRNLVSSFIGRS